MFIYSIDPNDIDSDSDGLNDYDEIFTYETDPNDIDSDGDAIPDGEEVYFFTPVQTTLIQMVMVSTIMMKYTLIVPIRMTMIQIATP